MSEVKTSEEKNIVIGIRNSLKNNTKYMYYDGIELKASQDVKDVRPESIEFKVVLGTYFNVSDYYLLKEVHNLGITNVDTLLKRIAIKKKNHPEREYPCFSYSELSNRMRFLVRQGLLYSFEYRDSYDRSMFIFCCGMYGWRVYKNKLDLADVYDKDMIFKAETEMFKRLSSSAVAYSFAMSPLCSHVYINDFLLYERTRMKIYARATLGDTDKTEYIIEPIYFNIDNRIISENENETNILNRLNQLEAAINSLNKESQVKLVLCVENYAGLTKLLKLIKTKDAQFYADNCYFTSENVVFESKSVLSRSFLNLSITSGKYVFGLAKDRWF